MSAEFCDTNVVVYAFDTTAGVKHERARQLLERLWTDGTGVVSIQVLQELFVTLTRKISRPLDYSTARGIVSDLATWQVIRPVEADLLAAIDATARWQISFWDAMIVTAAQRAGASIVWSEDLNLNATRVFEGVVIHDPFGT
jgi:predicted nucleic acid-binding protein